MIERDDNLGGDLNITDTRKPSSIKRMLEKHLTSKLHGFCSSLATMHREQKRALATALTTNEELVARCFRTMLQTVDEYGSFLSFEQWVRLQDLNGLNMGNRNHSEFTARAMVEMTAELWMGPSSSLPPSLP